jgi:rare lipoprotein A
MARGNFYGVALGIVCGFMAIEARAQDNKQFSGVASYYDKNYKGRTASGEPYDAAKFTAAHRTLPFGTRLAVVDPRTKRVVTVVVNDRGPFTKGRVLDLSMAAAEALHMVSRGVMKVTATLE